MIRAGSSRWAGAGGLPVAGCVLAAALGLPAGVAGCAGPLDRRADEELRRSIAAAVARELAEAERVPEPRTLTRTARTAALGLREDILAEVESMSGPGSYEGAPAPLAEDLYGGEQRVVSVSLERCVAMAAANNLDVEFARLAPAIDAARTEAAEAAFDWVFFAGSQWSRTDQPRTVQRIGGAVVGLSADQQQEVELSTGIRRRLESGGQVTFQTQYTYRDVETQGVVTEPDPAHLSSLTLQLDQPLLRNFGSDVALSQVRLSRNAERDSVQELKANLLRVLTETETAYWDLVQAQANLRILYRLLERGETVRRQLEGRLQYDVKPSEYSDAVATVESRRADVLRAQNVLRQASTRLKQLMNDPALTVGSEVLLLPVDRPVDAPVTFSYLDSAITALRRRPEVARALLSIDDTSIRQELANNARLPLLDLRAQTRFNGLGTGVDDTYNELTDGNFVDFLAGLNFEQPIGNREAEANFRARRIERMQAVVAYRNTVQGILTELKNSLQDVQTNYFLIEQSRAARQAAADNVRTLAVEEQTIRGLTPDFLDLVLRRQEALARREQEEVAALADYSAALARMSAAMGTALERNRIDFEVPDADEAVVEGDLFDERR